MFRYFLPLALIISISAVPGYGETFLSRGQSEAPQEVSLSPQAIIVYKFLRAAEIGDVELYKSTVSIKALKGLESWGITAADEANFITFMKANRRFWFRELEGVKLDSLRYVYKGNKGSGKVLIFKRRKKLSEVLVVLENGAWKITTGD